MHSERKPSQRTCSKAAGGAGDVHFDSQLLDARQQEALMAVLRALKRSDRPYFSDQQQSELFYHTIARIVHAIEESLPAPYFGLCHTDDGMCADEAEVR
jgi:hypothetical protein